MKRPPRRSLARRLAPLLLALPVACSGIGREFEAGGDHAPGQPSDQFIERLVTVLPESADSILCSRAACEERVQPRERQGGDRVDE